MLALKVGGCAYAKIDDLAFASLELVGRHDPLELKQMDARFSDVMKFDPPNELLLKTKFTSTVDLSTVDEAVTLGNKVFFCDRPKAHLRLALRSVFWQMSEVSWMPTGTTIRPAGAEPTTPITYHVFIRAALDEHGPGNPRLESFDLWRHPEDVCFRVEGGAYRALGYRSNTVVVSKEEIAAVLDQLSREDAVRRCAFGHISYVPPPG